MMEDTDLIELYGRLQEWHGKATTQLRLISSNKDAELEFNGIKIAPGSDVAVGIRMGIELSLVLLGKLPVKLNYKADDIEGL